MSVKKARGHDYERIAGRIGRRTPFDCQKVPPNSMTTQILFLIIAGLIVAAGLIGLVLPAFPGAILIFLGFLLAAWAEGFTHIGFGTLSALGIMALLIYAVDLIAGAIGAKRFGASTRAIVGASIGAVVGLFSAFRACFWGRLSGRYWVSCPSSGICSRPEKSVSAPPSVWHWGSPPNWRSPCP